MEEISEKNDEKEKDAKAVAKNKASFYLSTHISTMIDRSMIIFVLKISNHVISRDILVGFLSVLLESSHLLEQISSALLGQHVGVTFPSNIWN